MTRTFTLVHVTVLGLVATAVALSPPRKAISLTPQAEPLRQLSTDVGTALCDKMASVEECAVLPTCMWCNAVDSNLAPKCASAAAVEEATYTCQPAYQALQDAVVTDLLDPCMAYKDVGACHTNSTCTWCTAGAIPSECLSKSLAKMLPSAVFSCDAPANDFPGAACFGYADEEACAADSSCAYCKTKVEHTLPSVCTPTEMATLLPSALFDCPAADVASPLTCLTYQDQESCDADGECTFCKAAEDGLPSICSPAIPQVIQYLNTSGLFVCESEM